MFDTRTFGGGRVIDLSYDDRRICQYDNVVFVAIFTVTQGISYPVFFNVMHVASKKTN